MNTSQFMDKQIMDLMNHQPQPQPQPQAEEESSSSHINGDYSATDEEIVARYDFQPIRTVGASPPRTSTDTGTGTVPTARSVPTWGASCDMGLRAPSNANRASILEPQVLSEMRQKEERTVLPSNGTATLAEIDRTVKKYADNLLHALEGVSARLSQLESRAHHIESSMGDLNLVVGNYTGTSDGKLLQFENILREVQSGVQILRDKQEIMKTQHLSKLQQPSQPENQHQFKPSSEGTPSAPTSAQDTSLALPPPPHQLPIQVPPPPPQGVSSQTSFPPTPNAPPPPIQYPPQNQNPYVPAIPASNMPQYPPHMSQSALPSVPSYFPSQMQPVDPDHQQPYNQSHQSQPQTQSQQGLGGYQKSAPQPQPQVPPPSQYAQYSPNPTPQPLAEEANLPYRPLSAQPYPPRGPPPYMQQRPPSGSLPLPFYGSPPPHSSSGMYSEPPTTNRPGYSPQVGPYPYGGGSPSYRGGPEGLKPNTTPFASGSVDSGGDRYENLPMAKLLPQAAPVGAGSESGNQVPFDDVVEKVVMMGFSREQVRETVRKLTENGQNVDLNVVLDKLMNGGAGGDMIQPQKGWFNR